jgi:hypothetical protein
MGNAQECTSPNFTTAAFMDNVLAKLAELISRDEFQPLGDGKKSILRVGIHSIGSPMWENCDLNVDLLT